MGHAHGGLHRCERALVSREVPIEITRIPSFLHLALLRHSEHARLVSRETDPARRRNALTLLVALYISIAVFLIFGQSTPVQKSQG
jgi:hypothetical protein